VLKLRALAGFASMTVDEVAVIAENTVDRFFPAGSELSPEGEPVTAMHYVLEGVVQVRRKGETIQEFAAPAVVGGLGALAGIADGQQLLATEDCWTLEMSAAVMADVFEDNFTLLLMVIRGMAEEFINARLDAGPNAGFDQTIAEVEAPAEALSLVERLFYLRQSMTFGRGGVEMLLGLARDARERRVPAGTRLWKTGDPTGTWLVIVSGVVACENPAQFFRFGPGDSVGGLDALGGVERWFDARAESDVVALEIDAEVVVDLFEDNVDLALDTCRRIAGFLLELREANARARSAERRS
jgi:CRP-like cAMP-binding protein